MHGNFLMDFDASSGALSLAVDFGLSDVVGWEFSGSGQYLYLFMGEFGTSIYQVDLTDLDESDPMAGAALIQSAKRNRLLLSPTRSRWKHLHRERVRWRHCAYSGAEFTRRSSSIRTGFRQFPNIDQQLWQLLPPLCTRRIPLSGRRNYGLCRIAAVLQRLWKRMLGRDRRVDGGGSWLHGAGQWRNLRRLSSIRNGGYYGDHGAGMRRCFRDDRSGCGS